ncbi:MAG: MFS transporter [Hyphomonadaceae bacterium]|nr:MFS transporter [Hyphomonadaceae bacterium]
MTAISERPYTAADTVRWAALALVFGAAMLNYMDRQALALLKPELEVQFGWTDGDYAHINSGFQLATIGSMLAVGWFVDRAGLRAGYAIGVGGWSIAQMTHVLVTTVTGFFTTRVALAAFEAINLPAAVKTVATWFRGDDRSLALGIMNLAPNIGAVATPLLVPVIALAWGWKMAFILTGALGFVWLACWFMLPRPAGPVEALPAGPERNWSAFFTLLADRRTWAITLGKFFTDFVWVFLLFWGPDLFNKMYGLETVGLSLPVAMVFLMAGVGSLFAGTLSSWLLAKGRSFNVARKTPMVIAALLAAPVFAVVWAPNVWVAAFLLGMTLAAHQMFSTSIFGLATDVFPSRMTGLVIGIAATIAGFSGLAMNEYTGWVRDNGGSWAPMLALCAGAKIVAVIVVHVLVPNIDRRRDAMVAAEAA